MSLFIDTSALYALLDGDEPRHADVVSIWLTVNDNERILFTSNYVLVETFALVQRRLGLEAVRSLADVFVPLLQPVWVDEALHAAAVASLFTAAHRRLSLVDCASFEHAPSWINRRSGAGRELRPSRFQPASRGPDMN